MRVLWAIGLAAAFCGCSATRAEVWTCTDPMAPRDQAQVIEVVQDPGCMGYVTLAHIRAGGNVHAFDAMERVKIEARKVGADAITNVQRMPGTDEAIIEADAIAWLPR